MKIAGAVGHLSISAGRSYFGLKNRTTERTSHLAGLWIGADISYKSHSIRPVLPLSKEHGSQVKDQGGRQCCHNKHEKFPCRSTLEYFPDTLRISISPFIFVSS